MPSFIRKRLKCFYCNQGSRQTYSSGLRKWTCEHCDAINHLDSKGEITDPPAQEATKQTPSLGASIPRPKSPTTTPLQDSIFCQRCLQNQHLVMQNLANYLPPQSDPRYKQYEDNLPAYKRTLEERYPQVCVDCAPKAQARIRQSDYMANTDRLRRMREQTHSAMEKMKNGWRQTTLLTFCGCVAWFTAALSQLLWHGLAALEQESDGLVNDSTNLKHCLLSAISQHEGAASCTTQLHGWAIKACLLGLLAIWWNPVMRRRWIDRAVGVADFYRFQVIIIIVRASSLYFFGPQKHHEIEPQGVKAIHTFLFAFNVVIPLISYHKVYIAKQPRLNFQSNHALLIPTSQKNSATSSTSTSQRPTSQNAQDHTSQGAARHFRYERPVASQRPEPPVYHPPTPPPEDEYDEMEVDVPETAYNLQPTIRKREDEPVWTGPSPFYGKIPPAPVSMERQLRNPPNKPSFQKTSPERQESFFNSMTRNRSRVSNGHELQGGSSSDGIEMRDARLFTEQDRAAQETGLESWFTDFFSLGEPPVTTRPSSIPDQQTHPQEPSGSSELWSQLLSILSLLIALYCWNIAPTTYRILSQPLYFTSIGIAAIVSGLRLRTTLTSKNLINHSDLLLCSLELFGAAFIGYRIRQALLAGYSISIKLGSFPLWYLGFLLFQESSAFISLYREMMARPKPPPPEPEYRIQQEQPPSQKRGPSPLREAKALPVERSLAASAAAVPFSQQPQLMSRPSTRGMSAFAPNGLSRNGGFVSQDQTPTRGGASFGGNTVTNSFGQRVTRSQAQGIGESPGSKALSGLSLGGLGDETPSMQRKSARLRGRVVNPWEVGGM